MIACQVIIEYLLLSLSTTQSRRCLLIRCYTSKPCMYIRSSLQVAKLTVPMIKQLPLNFDSVICFPSLSLYNRIFTLSCVRYMQIYGTFSSSKSPIQMFAGCVSNVTANCLLYDDRLCGMVDECPIHSH